MLVSGTFFAVAAVGAACVAFPMTWLIKTLRRNKKRQWKYTSKLVDDAQDAFSNIKALRSMQRQGVFEQLFTTNIRVRKSLIRHQITRHALTHGQDLLMALTICAGIYAGAVLIGCRSRSSWCSESSSRRSSPASKGSRAIISSSWSMCTATASA